MKKAKGIDITTVGSGNVGAMNSYEVSNSKKLGIIVFLIDLLKGIIAVLIVRLVFGDDFIFTLLTALFAIFSHCFNPWLNFKGGRGLATALGISIIIFPALAIIWILSWIILYVIKKDILFANIFATLLSIFFTFILIKYEFIFFYNKPSNVEELLLFTSAVLLIIFIKHIEPLKELISKK
jgi:glycerol-3-phosphate acyltransferase PlsY